MKIRTVITASDVLYLLCMVLCSIFYIFANFDKATANGLGGAQLMFTFIAGGVFYRAYLDDRTGMPPAMNILYALAQIIPLYCWIEFYGTKFNLFPGVQSVNWIGIAVHSILIVWGVAIVPVKLYCRRVYGS